jgi:GNAT superfamily N-acetyltransferase
VIARRLAGIAAEPEHVVLVATDGATVLGYVEVAYERRLTANDEGTVRGLCVTADRRGHGVGTALMAAAESWARERGARRIRVRSQIERTETHAFYRRRGYTPLKTQHSFRRDF